MTTYEEIRGRIQSFDILLFSGRGAISRGIQAVTRSPWSHVAVALRLPQFDWLLCYESAMLSDIPDLATGVPVKGVQLVQLSRRLAEYEGDVAWRPIDGRRTPEMMQAAAAFMREFEARAYEANELELLKAALDSLPVFDNLPDTTTVFCSETTALIKRRVGIFLPPRDGAEELEGQPANEFTPADFAGDGLPFAPGFSARDIVTLGTDR